MTITITTDRNPEGWGADCDEATAARAAEELATLLAQYARESYPKAEVITRTEYVVSGGTSRLVQVEGASDEDWWEAALESVL
jgi:hypothetical protein